MTAKTLARAEAPGRAGSGRAALPASPTRLSPGAQRPAQAPTDRKGKHIEDCLGMKAQERVALSIAAAVATASLLSATVWLFQGSQAGQVWSGLDARPSGSDPACVAADPREPRDPACQSRLAAQRNAAPPTPRRGA